MPSVLTPLGRGPIFTAAFSASAISTSAPYDMFCLTAPSNSRVAILEIRLGQYSKFGDANAGVESLQIMAGSTAASGGAAITPQNVDRHTGNRTPGTVVAGPSTSLASTASAVVMLSDVWNVAAGYWYTPQAANPQMAIIAAPSEILNVRMLTPNEALTMNGTVTFQELGRV